MIWIEFLCWFFIAALNLWCAIALFSFKSKWRILNVFGFILSMMFLVDAYLQLGLS